MQDQKPKESDKPEKKQDLEQKDTLHSTPKEHKETKKKSKSAERRIWILLGFLAVVLLLFLGGYFYGQVTDPSGANPDDLHQLNIKGKLKPEQGYIYKGFSFVKSDDLWWTKINRLGSTLKVSFHNGPRDVENISITGSLEPEFNDGEEVFIAVDPTINNDKHYTLSLSELIVNVVKGVQRKTVSACTEEHEVCGDEFPILNCENTQGKPVVELEIADTPSVELNGTCIKIKGEGEDLLKSVDRLLFKWYKIMP